LDTAQTNIRDVFTLILIVRQPVFGLIDIRQSRCEDGMFYNDNTLTSTRRDAMFKNVLVPTDGSELSASTVARAIDFAKDAGARIIFFYAQPDFPTPIYGEGALFDPTTPEQFNRAAAAEAEKILAQAKSAAEAAGVSAGSDTIVSEVPFEAIIASAERNGSDLIFMASHGRRGLSGLLLGSETQKVLCPTRFPDADLRRRGIVRSDNPPNSSTGQPQPKQRRSSPRPNQQQKLRV